MIEQIKNVSYSVNALLGNKDSKLTIKRKLYFAVLYLAPGDYHRFHSPTVWTLSQLRHFAGEMFSVSPGIVSKIPSIFVLNERIAMLGEWRHGFFSMIPGKKDLFLNFSCCNKCWKYTFEFCPSNTCI